MISGYYGFGNCGDEAVLLAMVHCLKKLDPGVSIVVLSGNPQSTRELYSVGAVNRWNPFAVAIELLTCRLLISGGGSLLQDVTSTKSLRYYLSIINMAALFRKRVMIYGQGIGPLTQGKNRVRVSKAMNRCHVITVRDKNSAGLLRELGVTREIQITCDPVMALHPRGYDDVEVGQISQDLGEKRIKARKLLMVSVRHWNDDIHIAPVAELLDIQARRGWDVLLVPAHYPDDMETLSSVSRLMTERPRCLDRCLDAHEFIKLTARADMVFSMRLHGLICAFAAGTPMLGLSYDPKVDAFMEQAGLGRYCLHFDSFDSKSAEILMSELEDLPPQLVHDLEERRKAMRDMAWETARKANAGRQV